MNKICFIFYIYVGIVFFFMYLPYFWMLLCRRDVTVVAIKWRNIYVHNNNNNELEV